MRWLLVLFSLLVTRPVAAELVSMGVGAYRDQVVTSREVQISHLLNLALYDAKPTDKLRNLSVDSKAFNKAVADTLLESVIALEAQNFNLIEVPAPELKSAGARATQVLKDSAAWKNLQVSKTEFESAVARKLKAKKFIQFRAQSSILPVTDSEALKYFNENRLKFGNLPFENFKENIKSFLSRAQMDRRLKDWYDVLLSKYQVKNLIAEL